jgi:hypothetical protein
VTGVQADPRVVYLHIGAPKTGTTFIQQVLHANREALAQADVRYTADDPEEHFEAAVDLRGLAWGGREHPEWSGAWDRVAARSLEWHGRSVISNELLAGATPEQIRRAVDSLEDCQVHVIYTLRDLARMLRSDWQEQVKHRHAVSWNAYLHEVIDLDGSTDLGSWFWGLHDASAVLSRWSAAVPPERVHVICLPQASAADGALWREFATVIGLPPHEYDLGTAPANLSLGAFETEFLQRVNQRALDFVDDRSYAPLVGHLLIQGALAGRPSPARARFPARHRTWVAARSERMVTELMDSGYDIIGEPKDLAPTESQYDEETRQPTATAVYDLGADVAVRLLQRIDQLNHEVDDLRHAAQQPPSLPAEPEPPPAPLPGGRVKRWLRDASERHRSVMAVRRVWWWTVNTLRSVRHSWTGH